MSSGGVGSYSNVNRNNPKIMGVSNAMHTHPTGNVCSKCAKVMSSKQALRNHELKCNGLSKKQCPTCHKFFATPQSKHEHIKNVKCQPVLQHATKHNTTNNDNSITHIRAKLSGRHQRIIACDQDWKCNICLTKLPAAYQIDHVVPLQHGGDNSFVNLQALCPDCHATKTLTEVIDQTLAPLAAAM